MQTCSSGLLDLLRRNGGRHVDQQPAPYRGARVGVQSILGLIVQCQDHPTLHVGIRGRGKRPCQASTEPEGRQNLFPPAGRLIQSNRCRGYFLQHQEPRLTQLFAQGLIGKARGALAHFVAHLVFLNLSVRVLQPAHLTLQILIPPVTVRGKQPLKVWRGEFGKAAGFGSLQPRVQAIPCLPDAPLEEVHAAQGFSLQGHIQIPSMMSQEGATDFPSNGCQVLGVLRPGQDVETSPTAVNDVRYRQVQAAQDEAGNGLHQQLEVERPPPQRAGRTA